MALGVLVALPAAAAEVSVRTSVDKTKVTIGDRLKYTIRIEADPKVKVIPPDIGIDLGPFEIKDYTLSEPEVEGKQVTEVEYELATFLTGTQEIPPVTVTYMVGEERKQVKSQKLTITVESIAPSQAKDIKDIKPPTEVSPNWSGFRLVAAIAAGVLALVLLLAWYIRKRRTGDQPERVEPPPPAHVVAFQELSALRESSLLEEGRYKEFYSGIADALRRYLEGRYAIRALDETTTEIIDQLTTGILHLDRVDQLRGLLERCDLIKFAKFVPPDPEVDGPETLDLVWQFVDETKQAAPDEEDDVDEDDSDESDLSDVSNEEEEAPAAAHPQEPEEERNA